MFSTQTSAPHYTQLISMAARILCSSFLKFSLHWECDNSFILVCDITLLCHSICGINKMIDTCCEYAKEYDIKFNPTKTVCIKYGDKVQLYEHVKTSWQLR